MNVTVFGMGYVGCVTAALFADRGHMVTGVDLDEGKTKLVNGGKSPVIEPGLDELIQRTVQSGKLRATQSVEELGDLCLVCVGTPSNDNGSLGLSHVKRVVTQIGALLAKANKFHVVCIRSTVLPGTVEGVLGPILEQTSGKRIGRDFGLCMNPEFLRETTAIQDFYNPPFTVVGASDDFSASRVIELYAGIDAPVERTSLAEAETVKYACNAFHAVKVCFANEVGSLCKGLGVDSHRVMSIFCKDTKLNLSPYYLKPGFAFGGSCLPKDLRAILYKARQLDLDLPVLASLFASNRRPIESALELIRKTGKQRIGILGISFKSGTDDLRESPNVILVETLIGKGHKIVIYDEEVSLAALRGANKNYIEQAIPHISSLLVNSINEVIEKSDVVVVGKRHADLAETLKQCEPAKTVIDLVRLYPELSEVPKNYEGIAW